MQPGAGWLLACARAYLQARMRARVLVAPFVHAIGCARMLNGCVVWAAVWRAANMVHVSALACMHASECTHLQGKQREQTPEVYEEAFKCGLT